MIFWHSGVLRLAVKFVQVARAPLYMTYDWRSECLAKRKRPNTKMPGRRFIRGTCGYPSMGKRHTHLRCCCSTITPSFDLARSSVRSLMLRRSASFFISVAFRGPSASSCFKNSSAAFFGFSLSLSTRSGHRLTNLSRQQIQHTARCHRLLERAGRSSSRLWGRHCA